MRKSLKTNLAEGVGFEPTDPRGSPVFKTGAINRSTIPPLSASRLHSTAFSGLSASCFFASCCQLLPKRGKYADDGAWRAEHCEYLLIRASAVIIITSMGSRSTESESVFFQNRSKRLRHHFGTARALFSGLEDKSKKSSRNVKNENLELRLNPETRRAKVRIDMDSLKTSAMV